MNVPTRLAAFAALLGLAFGGAALAGAAIDPTDDEPGGLHTSDSGGESVHGGGGGGGGEAQPGLAISEGGYTLDVDRDHFPAGQTAPFTFRITDESGQPVRDGYQVEQEKELHFIVVRRDTAVFQHLHPERAADGTWSVDLLLPEAGVYRAYADFRIDGEKHTLGTDLFVPGDYQTRPLPAAEPTARAVDPNGEATGELDVTLDAPSLKAGHEALMTFVVTRGGQPFDGLEPYLGARGHLVALRHGDLAYLHVHPVGADPGHGDENGSADGGPHDDQIAFAATFPTPGTYRLFLQFNAAGEIRTAPFTVVVDR